MWMLIVDGVANLHEGALRKHLSDVAAQRWAAVDGAEHIHVS